MLIIRDEQMAVLELQARQSFEAAMVDEIRQQDAPVYRPPVSDVELVGLVHDAVDRAGEFSIQFREDVRAFVRLVNRYGPELDRDPARPWIGQILRDSSMLPADKLQLLTDWAPAAPGA